MMDPSRLLVLLELHEHGSVTRAAEHLGRTPPAVSQQLARLENEVGAQLVERHAHGVRLTPLGWELLDHARQVSDAVQKATIHAERHRAEHRDRLRLGAFPTAGLALLPEALAALRYRHPYAELSVVDLGPDEGIERVAEHRLDLALVGEYNEPLVVPTGVRLVHLVDDPVHAVVPVSHRHAANPVPRLSDFRADTWAGSTPELPNRKQLDNAAREEGFTPHVAFEFESYAVAEAMVAAAMAVSFIPELAIAGTAGTVSQPLASGLRRRIHAVVPASTRHAPLTDVFLGLLHDICAH